MIPWAWLIPAISVSSIVTAVFMAACAMGKLSDLETEALNLTIRCARLQRQLDHIKEENHEKD